MFCMMKSKKKLGFITEKLLNTFDFYSLQKTLGANITIEELKKDAVRSIEIAMSSPGKPYTVGKINGFITIIDSYEISLNYCLLDSKYVLWN